MTDSPAAAGRTTRNLRRVGAVAAAHSGVLLGAIVATEVVAAVHGSPGAHVSLYVGAMLCAVLAASCLSLAFARRLLGRSDERVDALAKKIDDLTDTNKQLVAESARWRAAERERAEVVGAMALVVERLGLRVEELEQVVCEVGVMRVLNSRPERLTHR